MHLYRIASITVDGVVGGGGVLIDLDGQMETKFFWGLGTETNNIAEALALW